MQLLYKHQIALIRAADVLRDSTRLEPCPAGTLAVQIQSERAKLGVAHYNVELPA